MIKELVKKLFNWTYGFNIEDLDPNKSIDIYFYQTSGIAPVYKTDGSVAADIVSDLGNLESITLNPGESYKIPTGLYIEMPENCACFLYSRSGLSTDGLLNMNGVGVIDVDYRGQMHFPVKNISNHPITIYDEDRIGQITITITRKINFIGVSSPLDLTPTKRGDNGFGHTGRN